jgi:hypothetical protein
MDPQVCFEPIDFRRRQDFQEEPIMKRSLPLTALIIAFCLVSTMTVTATTVEGQDVSAELPVLITSCGQSPGPVRIQFFMNRLKLDHEFELLATAEQLRARQESGNPIKTLMIVTGASLKGMGAAGISIEDELARTEALIEEAERQGITIVGAHIEGMDRRAQGAAEGDTSDEQSIDLVCPRSDLLIVREDGNADNRFSIIADNEGIPLILFEKNMELGGVLENLFQQ